MLVLGIETSCDETGVAIYDDQIGLIANQLYSQKKLHADYGGVVPELASRHHIRRIIPLIKAALLEAGVSSNEIDAVAYTAGPGLISTLLVGATVGSSLAFAWKVPAIPINHLEGHLLSPILENNLKNPELPFIALLVSGGHTQLINVIAIGNYQLLGESLDDAAGEAFDKIAKLLGLDYPGGSALSLMAQRGKAGRFIFPRPMTNNRMGMGLNFSFSGLKTAVTKMINNMVIDQQTAADIARAVEDAIVDTLVIKCILALKKTGLKRLVLAGGVSANSVLRLKIAREVKNIGGMVFYARPEFCTDNGAMIALTGALRFKNSARTINHYHNNRTNIIVKARWPLTELTPLSLL